MHTERTQGATYTKIRPFKGKAADGGGFPVYPNLVKDLVGQGAGYHEQAAHVCAVLSAWAYSEPKTVAMMAVRLGLEQNRCRSITLDNDTMFVCSSAFLIQSKCGRVAFLVYRGTEPTNLINWLTDIDISPATIAVPTTAGSAPPGSSAAEKRARTKEGPHVHGGFYRNQRATWFDVAQGIRLALEGRSIFEGTSEADTDEGREAAKDIKPLEALYITGHSLGGAMAALAAFRVASDPSYASVVAKVRAVYTFGQPMIGNAAFVSECDKHEVLREHVYRHVYGNDVVPALPPTAAGDFQHFGKQLSSRKHEPQSASKRWQWGPSRNVTTQLRSLPGIATAASDFWIEQIPQLKKVADLARHTPFVRSSGLGYSFYDHSTTYYIESSQPVGVLSEFGDF